MRERPANTHLHTILEMIVKTCCAVLVGGQRAVGRANGGAVGWSGGMQRAVGRQAADVNQT